MRNRIPCALLTLLLGANVGAEEEAQEPKKFPTPLRVQILLSRYQGERNVGSFPYTLAVNADDRPSHMRMGIQVPYKEVQGNFVYKSVGNNLECGAAALEDGRYRLNLTVEQSSVYSNGADSKSGAVTGADPLRPPVLRTFNSSANVMLRDGQSAQLTAATDPVSGEVLKIDVTLNVVK